MPYVRRDATGRIESVHRASAADAAEYLDSLDPELQSFLRDEFGAPAATQYPVELLVVLEEGLRLFLAKGLVTIEELSKDAQATWSRVLEAKNRDTASRFAASGFVEIIDDSAFGSLTDPR